MNILAAFKRYGDQLHQVVVINGEVVVCRLTDKYVSIELDTGNPCGRIGTQFYGDGSRREVIHRWTPSARSVGAVYDDSAVEIE